MRRARLFGSSHLHWRRCFAGNLHTLARSLIVRKNPLQGPDARVDAIGKGARRCPLGARARLIVVHGPRFEPVKEVDEDLFPYDRLFCCHDAVFRGAQEAFARGAVTQEGWRRQHVQILNRSNSKPNYSARTFSYVPLVRVNKMNTFTIQLKSCDS